MTEMACGLKMPEGTILMRNVPNSLTIVCPALVPPLQRTTTCACSPSRSTILPLPSSPHWHPITAITGISFLDFGFWILDFGLCVVVQNLKSKIQNYLTSRKCTLSLGGRPRLRCGGCRSSAPAATSSSTTPSSFVFRPSSLVALRPVALGLPPPAASSP